MIRLFWWSYLKVMGWNTDIVFPYGHLKKYVMIVGPHTSNWDFVYGLAYRSLLNLQHIGFFGKKELFTPPFGFVFRSLGGIPVDRKSSHNVVDQVSQMFIQHDRFCIALSPEGTRKKVAKLRTGFYHIASKAQVPIVMVGFDYSHKRIYFSFPFTPTVQQDDFDRIFSFYSLIQGKYPEKGL